MKKRTKCYLYTRVPTSIQVDGYSLDAQKEMRSLERIVSAYLDFAEDRAECHIPMTMENWAKRKLIFTYAIDLSRIR